jgi:hypothetical protein
MCFLFRWIRVITGTFDQVRRLIYECRCDERLKDKAERSTRLASTGLRGGLKIETRLIDERFGECDFPAKKKKTLKVR